MVSPPCQVVHHPDLDLGPPGRGAASAWSALAAACRGDQRRDRREGDHAKYPSHAPSLSNRTSSSIRGREARETWAYPAPPPRTYFRPCMLGKSSRVTGYPTRRTWGYGGRSPAWADHLARVGGRAPSEHPPIGPSRSGWRLRLGGR